MFVAFVQETKKNDLLLKNYQFYINNRAPESIK